MPTKSHEKERLDVLLVSKGLAPSRERARALVMAGKVLVDGLNVDKPGKEFPPDVNVILSEDIPYVSRGGLKLEAALDHFGINPAGLDALDGGASTGGFTDCLLKRGAARVIAVDVGYGQFDWTLRNDPRVTLLERTNLRYLDTTALPHPVDAAVADLSFISLKLVLGKFFEMLPSGGWLLALVKPQFEVGRAEVGKGGVVRNEAAIGRAVDEIKTFAEQCGFEVLGEMESPIRGPKGNREFFLRLVIPLRFRRGKNRGGPSCKKVLPDPLPKNFHHFSECSFFLRGNEHSENRGNFLP
ncbi:MAG: TlyA family RNA methyltransferase [Deltaproteobacteria bacterium]|nr:TlyA family RNA methyltransferase [Deltaproteobacteria bacterium]